MNSESAEVRMADVVLAQNELTRISVAKQALQAVLADWELHVDVNVVPDADIGGLGINVNIHKGNGQGFNNRMSAQTVQYWANDVDSLVSSLADEVVTRLYQTQIRAALAEKLGAAFRNAQVRSSK